MTPQVLKGSILQLAIQGKLVEQRPEDGTAEELCRQIQKENQALAKARKKSRKKNLCRRLQRMKSRLTFRRVGSGLEWATAQAMHSQKRKFLLTTFYQKYQKRDRPY